MGRYTYMYMKSVDKYDTYLFLFSIDSKVK